MRRGAPSYLVKINTPYLVNVYVVRLELLSFYFCLLTPCIFFLCTPRFSCVCLVCGSLFVYFVIVTLTQDDVEL